MSAATGDMGILANHVPSIEPLRPGIVEVIESAGSSKKWFGVLNSSFLSPALLILSGRDFLVSGGFATVHPNNKLTINAIEAAPLEDFSPEVRPSHVLAYITSKLCSSSGRSCEPSRSSEST